MGPEIPMLESSLCHHSQTWQGAGQPQEKMDHGESIRSSFCPWAWPEKHPPILGSRAPTNITNIPNWGFPSSSRAHPSTPSWKFCAMSRSETWTYNVADVRAAGSAPPPGPRDVGTWQQGMGIVLLWHLWDHFWPDGPKCHVGRPHLRQSNQKTIQSASFLIKNGVQDNTKKSV